MPPPVIPITSLDDPRVADFRAVKTRQASQTARAASTAGGEFGNGTFLAEGELVVKLLLSSRFRTRSICLTPPRLLSLATNLQSLPPQVPVYLVQPALMESIVGFDLHRGVLACGERGDLGDLGRLLESTSGPPKGLVILENLTNADNVGAAFRNTAALAGSGFGVVLSPACCDPLYRKAIRVSMGHALHVPFAIAPHWPDALQQVRAAGYTIVAMCTDEQEIRIDQVAPVDRPAILMGTEGAGLSKASRELADLRVRIPMAPGVDSLNVGVALAIALHRLASVTT